MALAPRSVRQQFRKTSHRTHGSSTTAGKFISFFPSNVAAKHPIGYSGTVAFRLAKNK